MMIELKRFLQSEKIISYDFPREVGYAKSVENYFYYQRSRGFNVNKVSLRCGFIESSMKIFVSLFSRHILINSLLTFNSYRIIALCFIKPVSIYLHETEFAFNSFKEENPLKFYLVKKILRMRLLLTVSESQAEFMRNLVGVCKYEVVGECVFNSMVHIEEEPNIQKVLMIGTASTRKGIDLFNEVARRCETHNFVFYWAGADPEKRIDESVVRKLGVVTDIDSVLENVDILFLSSVDDPFPLSVLEAVKKKKKIVHYINVGTTEILEGEIGFLAFDYYNAESAIGAISEVSRIDSGAISYRRAAEYIDVQNFAMRISMTKG